MDGSTLQSEPRFTNTWFRDYVQAAWERDLLPHRDQVQHYLEVGVCEGQSMMWVLENLLSGKEDPVAIGLDSYPEKRPLIFKSAQVTRDNAVHNLRPWIESGVLRLLQAATWSALRQQRTVLGRAGHDRFYDLMYLDGSHIAWDVMTDLVLCYPLLRKGGLLILDDYCLREWNGRPMTYHAAKAFEVCLGTRVEVVFRIPPTRPGETEPTQVCYRKRK